MFKKVFILFVVLLMTMGIAFAGDQEQMSPEEQEKQIQQQMQMMAPIFGQMMKVMMEAQLDVFSNPKSAEKLATYTRNYYEALIKKGFSKDEAMKIAMAVGFPAFPAMQQ